MTRHWLLDDAERTRAAGAALARAVATLPLDAPLIITLTGELGAGKTTFVGGFIQALGLAGAVRSPTYTLMEPYEFPALTVWHLDLYRLTDPLQLDDLGLRDEMQPRTVFLVEWPDRGGDFFAHPHVAITLRYMTPHEVTHDKGRATTAGRELQIQMDTAPAGLADSLAF